MAKTHIVTGATGFVGSAIVLELLRQTDDQITCIVRPRKNGISTETYLQNKLSEAALSYGYEYLLNEIPKRCRAITGDFTSSSFDRAVENMSRISEVWHCAASLEYRDKYKEQIFKCNIDGTKRIIALAQHLKAETFNYISTTYVAGSNVGNILEKFPSEIKTNNCYEESKCKAEKLFDEIQNMHIRIFRPSIVIGHSKTHVATSFSGLYGFMREVNLFRYAISKSLGSFLNYRNLRIRADQDTPLNFIPVDVVAVNTVNISLSTSSKRIFHITNNLIPSVSQTINTIFKEIGLLEPWYVNDERFFTSLDQELDKSIQFYNSYLRAPKTFDRTNTEEALGAKISDCPLNQLTLKPYIQWYANKLLKKSSSKDKVLAT